MNTDVIRLDRIVAPIEFLLQDDAVSEIMIDGHQRVLVERRGVLEEVQSPFKKQSDLENMITNLFSAFGVTLSPTNPVGELRLSDHSRVLAVLPPTAADGSPYLVLRKIFQRKITWQQLINDYRSVTAEAQALIEQAIASRANILISGGTGSGKTTIARLVTELIPAEERIIVAEDIYELGAEHPRLIHLEAGGPANLSFDDVLLTAAKMRPDRLIVGNLNGAEALRVMQLFGTGYDGSIAHTHATSAEDALNRLETMCLMAGMGLGLTEIRGLIASALNLVMHCERLPNGERRIMEITEVRGVENHRYILQPLMRYNPQSDALEATGIK